MKLIAPALLFSLLCLSGCRSDDAQKVEFPCICGTPEAAMHDCLHPACAEGETNPDNPDCACGTLSFSGKE